MKQPSAMAIESLATYQHRPLRVLQIHNFYQQRGGEDVVVQHEAALLQQAGVELYTWYVESALLPENLTLVKKLQLAWRLLWNSKAQQQLAARLAAQPVDVIHLHNVFPLLSPAIIHTAKRLKVPLLLTVHNFRWCQPSGCIQSLAEVNVSPWRYVGQALYRKSRVATALMVLHIQLQRWLGSYRDCARLICPSNFVKMALLQANFPAAMLQLKPHSVAMPVSNATHNDSTAFKTGDYALFVGRADAAKGLEFLLGAWQQVQFPLWVVGVTEQQAQQCPAYRPNQWLRFFGEQPHAALADFYQQARLLIVPSLVAETFGNVVIEAFSKGTPCLVSDVGALPELVLPNTALSCDKPCATTDNMTHNMTDNMTDAAIDATSLVTAVATPVAIPVASSNTTYEATAEITNSTPVGAGLVFRRADERDFLDKLKHLLGDMVMWQQMSHQARQRYQDYYLPQQNQQALLACYQQVLAEQGTVVGG